MIEARIAGRYVLLALLGTGGEARVFRARDEKQGYQVAVRLPLDSAASVAQPPPALKCEQWVQFIEAGTDAQHGAYQVLELLEGPTLAEMVRTAPLSREGWQEFVDQSLSAVEAVHGAGWVHGDLNADNFVRTSLGWKLLELPFYHFAVPAARSSMFGSIHTVSPEQIDGIKPAVPSDLYALGCLYYFAGAGRWPHPGKSVQEIAVERLMQAPESLRDFAPGLPAAVCDWVMLLLARHAGDRPPTVAAARQLLADAVA